jgi:anti-sigma factor RsiW
MGCQVTQDVMQGYLDGELDLIRNLEIERHLQDCQICSGVFQNHQVLRSAITAGALYYKAPANLQKRVLSEVRKANEPETVPWVRSWRWLSVGASLAAVALLAWILAPVVTRSPADDPLTQEIIAAHIRSLMPSHVTDVSSTDQHTVKPWFNGKLDFSPPVTNLADQGFPLVGGRLDYLANRPVAALVYQRREHIINLFIWHVAPAPDTDQKTSLRQGYYLVHWTKSGMTYWAVSDLNQRELQEFVQQIRSQTVGAAL